MNQKYESMIIIDPKLPQEEAKAENEKFVEFMKSANGELIETNFMGRRRLAFEIENKTEGYYFVNYFNFENQKINVIDRYYKLNENIFRHNILRIED